MDSLFIAKTTEIVQGDGIRPPRQEENKGASPLKVTNSRNWGGNSLFGITHTNLEGVFDIEFHKEFQEALEN